MEQIAEQTNDNHQRGFSLLEVTVAILLTVGLMAIILSLATRNQQVFVTESGVIDMNQNVRTALDMVTRDVQSAGVGLPSATGNFASIFYTDGASGAPDTILMLNGDPFAPVADLTSRAAGSAEFFVLPPPGVTATGNGSNTSFTYIGENEQPKPIYKDSATDGKRYIVYDDTHAMIFALTKDGQLTGSGGNQRLKLQHNPTSYLNPPSVFGTVLDTEEPDYGNSTVAMLGSTVGYRVNTTTKELERTEDLQNWFPVARGIINFQIRYRLTRRINSTTVEETIADKPGDASVKFPSGAQTERAHIRSIIIRLEAETPDVPSGNQHYRRIVNEFEVAPRNLNLIRNNFTNPREEEGAE